MLGKMGRAYIRKTEQIEEVVTLVAQEQARFKKKRQLDGGVLQFCGEEQGLALAKPWQRSASVCLQQTRWGSWGKRGESQSFASAF